jgi:hypothetical protein
LCLGSHGHLSLSALLPLSHEQQLTFFLCQEQKLCFVWQLLLLMISFFFRDRVLLGNKLLRLFLSFGAMLSTLWKKHTYPVDLSNGM